MHAHRDTTPSFEHTQARAFSETFPLRLPVREGVAEGDHLGVVGADFDAESTLAYGVEECWGYDVGGDARSEVLADEACFCEDDGCEGAVGGIEF